MRKLLITILTLTFCIGSAFSLQAQRRLPGQKAVQISTGFSDGYKILRKRNIAFHAGVALSRYMEKGNKWLYGIEYFEKRYCYKCHAVPVSAFTFEGGYFYSLFSDRGKNIFLSAGLSGLGGFEVCNWGKKRFDDGATLQDGNNFIGGCAVTIETETFVHDRLAIMLNLRERFILGSDVGKFHCQIVFGLKYIYK